MIDFGIPKRTLLCLGAEHHFPGGRNEEFSSANIFFIVRHLCKVTFTFLQTIFPSFLSLVLKELTTQAPGANNYYIKLIIAIFKKQSIVLWFFFCPLACSRLSDRDNDG